MAYISNSTAETPDAASAGFTPTLLPHVANDLIVLFVFQDNGGTTDITTATAGWNKHGTFGDSQTRGGFFSKLAASSSETAPVFAGRNDEWGCVQLIVKDADTSTPVEAVSTRVDFTTAQTFNSATLTTLTDNALLLYGCCNDGILFATPSPTSAIFVNGIAATAASTQTAAGTVGCAYKYTAGAVGAITYTKNATSNSGGNSWVIAIKNKASGALGPHPGGTAAYIEPAHASIPVYGAFTTPSAIAATINSINTDTTAIAATTATVYNPEWAKACMLSSGAIADSSTSLLWSGPVVNLTSTVDLDGKNIGLTWGNTSNSTSGVGAGVCLILADASLNYEAFNITVPYEFPPTSMLEFMLNPSATTATYSSGTLDYTAIKYIGVIYNRQASSRTQIYRSLMNYGSGKVPYTVLGGSGTSPCTPATISNLLSGWGQGVLRAPLQGQGQVLLKCGIQIGDGSTPTYFQLLGGSIEFPATTTTASKLKRWSIADNAFALQVYASASDTMDFRGGLLGTTAPMDFTIHASSSTSATYYWNGLVISGPWDVTWKTGITAQSITFTGCDEINFKGADVAACYVQKTVSTDAAIAFDASGATVTDTTIDVTGTSAAYHIELGASVESVTLTDVTFTGTPGTDKVHVKKTSGTCTITISGTTSLAVGDVTTDGATVVVSAPELYQSVTLSGCRDGSRIQLFDENAGSAGEELYNDIPESFPFTWTDPAPAAVERSIRLRIAYYDDSDGLSADLFEDRNIGTCGLTAGTASIPYNHEPEEDPVYIVNATDGSGVTGITVDDALFRCRIAVGAITWAEIYAYNVYWLWTEEGIRDEGSYIDAPDPANYLFHEFQIVNDTDPVVPLVISGGYGRDADTGTVADIIDTSGGSIFPQPDHVVGYATGSGPLTVAQDAKLSAVYSGVSTNLDAKVSDTAQPGDEMTLTAAYNAAKTAAQPDDIPAAEDNASAVRTELAVELAHIDEDISTRASQESLDNLAIAGTAYRYPPTAATRAIGTDQGGTYSSLAAHDEVYMSTGEVVGAGLDVVVTVATTTTAYNPSLVNVSGYYAGTSSHSVEVYAYNYSSSSWQRVGTMLSRSSAFDYTYPLQADNVDAGTGEMKLRFLHNTASPYIATHRLHLDYISFEKVANDSTIGSTVAEIYTLLQDVDAEVDSLPSASATASAVRTELAVELARIDANISDTAQPGDAMTLTEAYAAAKTAAQPDDIPAAATNASAVRTELTSELAKIVDIHRIKGLDAAHPVTATGDGLTSKTVSADGIEIEITPDGIERTV